MASGTATSTGIVPGLTFQLLHDNKVGVFAVNGEVSFSHVNLAVLRGTEEVIRHDCHVIVDFTHAADVYEERLGLLAYGQSFIRKRGRRFALVAPRNESLMRKVAVDMRKVFSVYPCLEDAARALLSGDEESLRHRKG